MAYGLHSVIPGSSQVLKNINIYLACDRTKNLIQLRTELEKQWTELGLGKKKYYGNEKYYNAKHKLKSYRVGDKIWLSDRNIRTSRPTKKLGYKYHGSFIISKSIGKQAYELDLTKALQNIPDVFHISLLKPYHTVEGHAPPPSPSIEIDGEDQAEIEEVLDSSMHYGKLRYLAESLEYSLSDNEYILADNLSCADEYMTEFY